MGAIDFDYNDTKMKILKSDYSLFHPSETQLSMIYELSSNLSLKLGIEEVVMRQIYIKSFVKWQEINKQLHFENEQNLSQFKLVRSTKINDIIIDNVWDLTLDQSPDIREQIEEKVAETFAIYVNKYAGRSN